MDRVLLIFRQPRLQYGQGIHGFFCHHRGNQFVSSALMRPMTERFAADIRHYIDVRGLDLVRFAKGQSKDQFATGYLAGPACRLHQPRPAALPRTPAGETPEDMTSGQISYDLRRLHAHQIIERIPHSRAYQVTADGLALALFFTRLTRRVLIPGLTDPGPPPGTRLRQADRAHQAAITELAQQASIAA